MALTHRRFSRLFVIFLFGCSFAGANPPLFSDAANLTDPPAARLGKDAALDALESFLFPKAEIPPKPSLRTDGIVVLKHGAVVYERYGNGYSADMRHAAWSVSKSFVNALVGILVRDGKMTLTDSLCKFFPSLEGKPHCKITVDDLLRFSSGLRWLETYEENQSPTQSSVLAMLYGVGHRDMAKFVLDHPVIHTPGTEWFYSSGETVVLMAILKEVLGSKNYPGFAQKELFGPLGMKDVLWERDAAGTFVGSSYVYASPRELAKFGQLYLQDGVWEGKRILPKGWVDYSTRVAPSILTSVGSPHVGDVTGALFWLNKEVPEKKLRSVWPDAPQETYAASGHWGQWIVMIPSKGLVIARTGEEQDGRDKPMDPNTLIRLVLNYVSASPPAWEEPKSTVPEYANKKSALGVGFQAKEACSCVFVSRRSDAECESLVAFALKSKITIDRKAKTVRAKFLIYHQQADFLGEELGCVLR